MQSNIGRTKKRQSKPETDNVLRRNKRAPESNSTQQAISVAAPASAPRGSRARAPRPPVSVEPPALCNDRPSPGHQTARAIDHAFKANLARVTGGLSPAGLASLYFNWFAHMALSPGKQLELAEKTRADSPHSGS